MTYKNIEPHRHCECGKILPPNQPMCMQCVSEALEAEANAPPRQPYYVNEMGEYK